MYGMERIRSGTQMENRVSLFGRFCRLACFASVTRYTGQSHTQYLVPGRAASFLSLLMPSHLPGRIIVTRSRSASSAVSLHAPPPAAHDAAAVAASYSLTGTDSYADRRGQAQADAGEGKEEAVEGGEVGRGGSESTDSTSSNVHSGHGQAQDRKPH